MAGFNPLSKEKSEFSAVIERIKSEASAVGIDAQLTHAIIIEYLQQILKRVDNLEEKINNLK